MTTVRKFIKLALIVIVLASVACVVAYFTLLPAVARSIIASSLRNAGIEEATFKLRGVNLREAEIEQLSIGKSKWASIGSLRATYGLSALWTRRLNTLVLNAAEWKWTILNGVIDFGLTSQQSSSGGLPNDLPFDRLELKQLTLSIDHDQRTDRFVVSGTMTRTSANTFNLDLEFHNESMTEIQFGSMAMRAPTGTLHLAVTLGQTRMDVTVRPECSIVIDALSIGMKSDSPRTMVTQLVLAESSQPLIRLDQTDAGVDVRLNAIVNSTSPIQIKAGGVESTIPSATGTITIATRRDQAPTMMADIALADATFKHESSQLKMTGIEAKIPVDFNLPDLRLGFVSAKAVTWKEKALPGFTADIGFSGDRAEVKGTWDTGATGRFTIAPVQFDPANPVLRLELMCERIGLEEWLPLLTDSRAFGTGSLSGSVSMEVAPRKSQWMSFVRGGLRSDPGGGVIQSRDARQLSAMLDESDPRFVDNAQFLQIKERVIGALEDFAYDSIAIEFKPVDDRVPFSIDLRGKGRQGPTPQELSLTVNVNDLLAVIQAAGLAKSVGGSRE